MTRINFTWITGSHNVIIAPGQSDILNGTKQWVVSENKTNAIVHVKKNNITFTFELLASNTLHSQMLQPVKTNIFSTLPVIHSMLDSLSVCTVC